MRWTDLLSPTLHHLCEQGDAIQVDELLGEGDVTGRVGQVLQCLQLGIHAGRLDPLMKSDCSLVLEWESGGGGGNMPSEKKKKKRIIFCLCIHNDHLTYRRGGQAQDWAVLNVIAILWRFTRMKAVSEHLRHSFFFFWNLGRSCLEQKRKKKNTDNQTFSVM